MKSDSPAASGTSTSRASVLVAAGILLSRIGGLVRTMITAPVLGQKSDVADAWAIARSKCQ